MPSENTHSRLPRNFHKTFKPERQYISAMLQYAASGQAGDYQAIASATGIPTGTSSGKVPAILDYCRGMGLVTLASDVRTAVKRPELTPFGRMVYLEDLYLKEAVTQWIAHFNLCSPLTGADVWLQVFFAGAKTLGMTFTRETLQQHLSLIYQSQGTGLIGPLIGTYEDEAAFALCGALNERDGSIRRTAAPIAREFGLGFGAWILQLMFDHFPMRSQVSLAELDARAGWRTIPGWDIPSVNRVLRILEQKGIVDVDRHMDPWLLSARMPASEAWSRIYDDLI